MFAVRASPLGTARRGTERGAGKANGVGSPAALGSDRPAGTRPPCGDPAAESSSARGGPRAPRSAGWGPEGRAGVRPPRLRPAGPARAAMAVHYCGLCRRTSFSGRRHLYGAAHRRRLQEALGRLQEAVAAAREAAAAAAGGDGGGAVRPYDPAEHERRVWCLCCGRGVRRDGRRGGLALPQAGLLQHLAG